MRTTPLILLTACLLTGTDVMPGYHPLATALAGGEKALPPGVPDAAFQKEIDAAVKKGTKYLEGLTPPYGGVSLKAMGGAPYFEIGTTSLVGLALLAGGEKKGERPVDAAMTFAKDKDQKEWKGHRTTYDTGTLLMFLTEYFRGEAKAEPPKGTPKPAKPPKSPCGISEEIRPWIQEMVDELVEVRKKETGTWGYPQHEDDYSNTQYAFLGLRLARECGAHVPDEIFEEALKTTLARQEKDGPKILRILPATGPGEKNYAIDSGDRARGWSYHLAVDMPSGSMTTAAIAILSICNDVFLRPTRSSAYTPQLERDVQRAVQDGFSWLDKWWTVEKNPMSKGGFNWHYYYLYGLERACVFGGKDRDLVGAHDWYLEGAKVLVKQQKEDGRWSTGLLGGSDYAPNDALDTAWAILFLKRATRPLVPVRAPVVTKGD